SGDVGVAFRQRETLVLARRRGIEGIGRLATEFAGFFSEWIAILSFRLKSVKHAWFHPARRPGTTGCQAVRECRDQRFFLRSPRFQTGHGTAIRKRRLFLDAGTGGCEYGPFRFARIRGQRALQAAVSLRSIQLPEHTAFRPSG